MKKVGKIILFEPQCRGIEHLVFNSCIIATIQTIFEDSTIILYADKDHIDAIQRTLNLNIQQIPLILPCGCAENMKRRLFDLTTILTIKKFKPDILICLSVTPLTVLFSKIFLEIFLFFIFYFFHGVLETLTEKYYFWNYNYWLRPSLSLKRNNTTHIVLGENTQKELRKLIPNIAIKAIDHPYFIQNKNLIIDNLSTILNIGTVGFACLFKGSNQIFELEQNIGSNIQLHHIGKIIDPCICVPKDTRVKIHGGNQPLPPEEFNALIDQLHFCVFFYPQDSYRLTASGAIFDALTHLKPIIAIRNPYFEYIFYKMGNIGYLCDTIDEMTVIIGRIVKERDVSEYRKQQKIIQDGLKYFSPEYIEKSLLKIFMEAM
jgi:hypothetical protein